MGQILSSRNPMGTVGIGLFLVALSAFVYGLFDPLFGPIAMVCLAAGTGLGVILGWRRPRALHVDPRLLDASGRDRD